MQIHTTGSLKETDAEKVIKTFEKEFKSAYKELGIKEVNYREDGLGFVHNGYEVTITIKLKKI